jgi:hypothetical protein
MMIFYRLTAAVLCLSVLLPTAYAEDNTAEIQFSGTLVNPPDCTLSNTDVVRVNFGSINVDDVISMPEQPIPLAINCTGGTASAFSLTLEVTGQTVDFGDSLYDKATLITPENPDLGIRLIANGFPLTVNHPMSVGNEDNLKTLKAVLVGRPGAVLEVGDFTAIATLRAYYQ